MTFQPFRLFSRSTKRPLRRTRRLVYEVLESRQMLSTVVAPVVADNTLYQDPTGSLSDAAGQFFFVGTTNQASNEIRRAVMKFDLSGIPAGSTITGVSLKLNMTLTTDPTAEATSLSRLLKDWGNGTSLAPGQGGAGTAATTNDVTWVYTFFNTQSWTNPGGDFATTPSAVTPVGGVGSYTWASAGMIADVQQWINNPSMNFGWILIGNEATAGTARQFGSSENLTTANQPQLTIDFTPPSTTGAPDLTIAKSHEGKLRVGDAADTFKIVVTNSGTLATTGTVTVTDTLPAGLSPTAADTGTVNGWTVSFSGQTITATRSDVLNPGHHYAPLIVTVAVSASAPTSVTNTVTVAGGGEVNTANDTASDTAAIAAVAHEKENEHDNETETENEMADSGSGEDSSGGTTTTMTHESEEETGSRERMTDSLPTATATTAMAADDAESDLSTMTTPDDGLLAAAAATGRPKRDS